MFAAFVNQGLGAFEFGNDVTILTDKHCKKKSGKLHNQDVVTRDTDGNDRLAIELDIEVSILVECKG